MLQVKAENEHLLLFKRYLHFLLVVVFVVIGD